MQISKCFHDGNKTALHHFSCISNVQHKRTQLMHFAYKSIIIELRTIFQYNKLWNESIVFENDRWITNIGYELNWSKIDDPFFLFENLKENFKNCIVILRNLNDNWNYTQTFRWLIGRAEQKLMAFIKYYSDII